MAAKEDSKADGPRLLIEGVYVLFEPRDGVPHDFDIVFIHGLQVDMRPNFWLDTWRVRADTDTDVRAQKESRQRGSSSEGKERSVWPQEWLPEDFPMARVLALAYDSAATKERGTPLALWEIAVQAVQSLTSPDVGLGKLPFFLIGHSFGGLMAKELLLEGTKPAFQDRELRKNCRGLVFYGVPHLGAHQGAKAADLASFFNALFLGTPTPSGFGSEELKELGEKSFRRNLDFHALEAKTFNFVETVETPLARGVKVMLVKRMSAAHSSAANSMCFINADHFNVCKPVQKTDRSYRLFVEFVARHLKKGADVAVPRRGVHNIPVPKNVHFCGRAAEMARLDEQLGDEHAIECLWGMAGMGKSQLMLEYAHTHLHDYDWLLWVDGGAEPELRTSYAGLCNHPLRLQLQREEGEDPDSLACRRVKRFLEETPDRCLLMLDDVEEQQHLVDLMPATGNCHVLITTRKNGGFAYSKGLGLETLAEADAWALVTGGTECRDDCEAAALRQLCTELEFLTLELAVVRGILAKGGMQPSKLLDLLRKKGEWSRSPADPGFRNRDVKLGKLFDQSLAAMRRGASGEALELAERMALVGGWFASTVIRTPLLVSAVQKLLQVESMKPTKSMAFVILWFALAIICTSLLLSSVQKSALNGVLIAVAIILMPVLVSAVQKSALVRGWFAPALGFIRMPLLVSTLVDDWFASATIRTPLHGGSMEKLVEMAEGEAVPLLVEYNLATGDGTGVRFHRLVQNYMRHRAPHMWCAVLLAVEKEGIVEDDVEHFRVVWNRSLEESHSDELILRSVKVGMALASFIGEHLSELKELERIVEGCLQKMEALSREPGEGMTYKCEQVDLAFSRVVQLLNKLKGHLLDNMGRYTEAEVLLRSSLAMSAEVLGDDHPTTLEDRSILASNLSCQGRFAEAESEHRSVLEARQRVLGPEHRDTLESRRRLANKRHQLGQHAGIEEELREVLRIRERVLGATDLDTLRSRLDIAILLAKQGQSAEADAELSALPEMKEHELWAKEVGQELLETVLFRHNVTVSLANDHGRHTEVEAEERALLEKLESLKGTDHPHSLSIRSNLASLFAAQGLHAKSELEHRRVLEARVRVLGAEHPDSLRSRYNVASLLKSQGKYAEAEKELRAVLEISQRVLRPEHLDVLTYRLVLASVLLAQGHLALAAVELNALLKIYEPLYGAEHPHTLRARHLLAVLLRMRGQHEEAEKEYRAILETMTRTLGPEHRHTIMVHVSLAATLQAQGRYTDAEAEHRALLEPMERVLGAKHRDTLKNRDNLARALHMQGRYEESEAMHRLVLKMRESVLGAEHEDTLHSRQLLALTLQQLGRHAETQVELRAVFEMKVRVLGPDHPDTLHILYTLACLLHQQGKFMEAEMELRRVLESSERVLGAEHEDTLRSRELLALTLQNQGRHAEAKVEQRAVVEMKVRVLGPDHPDTLCSLYTLALMLQQQGKFVEAEMELRRVLESSERVLGAEHEDTLRSRQLLALTLEEQGRHAEAKVEHRAVLEMKVRVLGPDHPDTLRSLHTLALMLRKQWTPAACDIDNISKALPHMLPDPSLAGALNSLAWRMQAEDGSSDLSQAEAFARKAVEMERVLEAGSVHRENALDTLAVVLQKQGKLKEALSFAQEAVGIVNTEGWQGEDPEDIRGTLEKIEAAIACLTE